MRDSDYIFHVARIRVLEKALLSDEMMQQLVSMKDTNQIRARLREVNWGIAEGSADQSTDTMLAAEEHKLEQSINELKLDRRLLEVLDLPQRYHNMKTALKEVIFGRHAPHAYFQVAGYEHDRLVHAISAKEFTGYPADMVKAVRHALDVVSTLSDAQWCDAIMDKACLIAQQNAAQASKSVLLEQYTEILVENAILKICFRSVHTGKSESFLREAICDTKSLEAQSLIASILKGEKDLIAYLVNHGFDEAVEASQQSPARFEQWCEMRLLDVLASQDSQIMSAGPILAYVLRRRAEIRNVRILLTAKANGFDDEAILERMCVAHV